MRKAALCLLAVAAGTGPARAEMTFLTLRYQCERGVEIVATYVNSSDGSSAAVINAEGRQIALEISRSASGARYAAPSGGPGYVWWTKGNEGTLFWSDGVADDEATIYADCRATP